MANTTEIPNDLRVASIKNYSKTIIATGNKTSEQANDLSGSNLVNLVGFGCKFLTNPDYPQRVKVGAAMNEISDNHTLFDVGDAKGYTDYPFFRRIICL